MRPYDPLIKAMSSQQPQQEPMRVIALNKRDLKDSQPGAEVELCVYGKVKAVSQDTAFIEVSKVEGMEDDEDGKIVKMAVEPAP